MKNRMDIGSESVAITALGFEIERDLMPGDNIYLFKWVFSRICAEETSRNPCIFEYVYFARPDSVIDGISVYRELNPGKS